MLQVFHAMGGYIRHRAEFDHGCERTTTHLAYINTWVEVCKCMCVHADLSKGVLGHSVTPLACHEFLEQRRHPARRSPSAALP
jgi:hypothetical protein